MRRLILFRHAKAEPGAGAGDFGRGLTARGKRDANEMGRRLAAQGEKPDIVLLSTAKRTRQTWAAAKEAFGEVRTEPSDALYDAPAEVIAGQIKAFEAQGETLMVIGHNPGLQELAVLLLAQGSAPPRDIRALAESFPTAAAAVFRVDAAGRCALDAFERPREGK